MPSGRATSRNCARCAISSEQVWCTVSTGAPDSSNCPPGSSEIAPPPVTSNMPMMLPSSSDRLPAEQVLHAFEQRADAAPALIGDRPVAFDRERKFLVLGADAEFRLRLHAFGEPRDELVARFDRRHVDLITSHDQSRLRAPAPARTKGRDHTRAPSGRAMTVTATWDVVPRRPKSIPAGTIWRLARY